MIIGMVGFIGSGKGTVGDYLQQKRFVKESFAKPLKDAVAIIFNWPRHLLEGDTEESRKWRDQVDVFWSEQLGWEVTPRLVLQKMGTEAGRNVFGYPLWTASLINRLDINQNYVITDVRFENEIKAIRDIGGILVRVARGSDPEWFELAQTFLRNFPEETLLPFKGKNIHISEYGWVNSPLDQILHNDGSLVYLYQQIDGVIDYYQKQR